MGVLEGETPADRLEERIIEIEMERLRDFRDHPFRIKEDQEMKDLFGDSYISDNRGGSEDAAE